MRRMTTAAASPASFYVSPTGSDNNNGSQSAPFRTIQKAANVVSAGYTIHVAPGTYREMLYTTKNGTAAARIRYVSDVKWGAKIVPPTAQIVGDDIMWYNTGNYVDIEGFELNGISNLWFRVGLWNEGANVRIYRNHILNVIGTSPDAIGSAGGTGLGSGGPTYDTPTPVEIFENVVHNIGDPDHIYRTEFNSTHCYYVQNPGGTKLYNNIGWRSENSCYVMSHNPQGMIASNNIAFADAYCGFYVSGQDGNVARNNIYQNNIAIGNGQGYCVGPSADNTNLFINNISWGNGSRGYSEGNQIGLINQDPKLVNYKADGSGDYHLTAASPAIDRGRAIGAPSTDFDGNIRPVGAGIDIGPYEYGSGGGGSE